MPEQTQRGETTVPGPGGEAPSHARPIRGGDRRRGDLGGRPPDQHDGERMSTFGRDAKLRVLQVIGDGRPGGGATVVLGLARDLARLGVAVTVASDAGSHILDEASRANIPVLGLDFSRRRRSVTNAQLLHRHLRLFAPALVHAHGARAGVPVSMMAMAARVPIAYTVHGFHFLQKPPVAREFAKLAERYCIRQARMTVFVSRHDAEIARREGLIGRRTCWKIIHNGSPWAEPSAPAQMPSFDIVYLGRLVPGKNVLILPRILLALRPARPSLCIIGGGEAEVSLRRAVGEAGLAGQVTFLGSLRQSEAVAYLSSARVLILPSRWEGLPMCVIEAAHRGLPTVASNVGGTREVVTDGETGYLVEVDDVASYAQRLRQLLDDESLRRKMGQSAVAKAREEFSIERQVSSYLGLYSRLASAAAWNFTVSGAAA